MYFPADPAINRSVFGSSRTSEAVVVQCVGWIQPSQWRPSVEHRRSPLPRGEDLEQAGQVGHVAQVGETVPSVVMHSVHRRIDAVEHGGNVGERSRRQHASRGHCGRSRAYQFCMVRASRRLPCVRPNAVGYDKQRRHTRFRSFASRRPPDGVSLISQSPLSGGGTLIMQSGRGLPFFPVHGESERRGGFAMSNGTTA